MSMSKLNQKFSTLSFVRVENNGDSMMQHFNFGYDGIVEGTYAEMYGGDDVKSYSIYQIDEGRIVNHTSWYQESQLSLLPNQDPVKADEMIEDYKRRTIMCASCGFGYEVGTQHECLI